MKTTAVAVCWSGEIEAAAQRRRGIEQRQVEDESSVMRGIDTVVHIGSWNTRGSTPSTRGVDVVSASVGPIIFWVSPPDHCTIICIAGQRSNRLTRPICIPPLSLERGGSVLRSFTREVPSMRGCYPKSCPASKNFDNLLVN